MNLDANIVAPPCDYVNALLRFEEHLKSSLRSEVEDFLMSVVYSDILKEVAL